MQSILQSDHTKCYLCGRNSNFEPLDKHHVFGGAFRKKSEKYGLTVYLHHQTCHLDGVHKYAKWNRVVQRKAQLKAMKKYSLTTDEFRQLFGRNYLEKNDE